MAEIPNNRSVASTITEHLQDHTDLADFNNLIDAAGDLIVGTGVDTAGRLAKGTALQSLRTNAGATALEWAAPFDTPAWAPWIPTLGNITLGNGTVTAAYAHLGKTVHFRIRLLFGTTTTMGAAVNTFSLPVNSVAVNWTCACWMQEDGVGPKTGAGFGTATTIGLTYATGWVTATVPFTWGNLDVALLTGTYEAA